MSWIEKGLEISGSDGVKKWVDVLQELFAEIDVNGDGTMQVMNCCCALWIVCVVYLVLLLVVY